MNALTDAEILLIEDNPRDAELTQRALKAGSPAHSLIWVKDGAQALEFLFGPEHPAGAKLLHRPKIIVLDLKLPKINGLELLRHIKSDPAAKTIPIVVLTSSREKMDIVRCYELGVNSYIVKPVDFDHFSHAVAQLGVYWLSVNQPPELPQNQAA